jgi:hypothetical protein
VVAAVSVLEGVDPVVLRALLEYRRNHDPLDPRNLKYSEPQQKCDDSKALFTALVGVNRGGKSAYWASRVARCARRIHPTRSTNVNGTYLIFAPSRGQLAKVWGKKLFKESELVGPCRGEPMIPPYEIEGGKPQMAYGGAAGSSPALAKMKNGHEIMFCVSEDKNVWKRIAGLGMILGVVLDEQSGDEKLLAEIVPRLLDAMSDEQVKREAGGAWLGWGFTRTTANMAAEEFLAKCEDPSLPDYEAFHLGKYDNPAIQAADRERLRTFLSEEDYQIRMEGEGGALSSMLVYPQWDDQRHMLAADYIPTERDTLWCGYDPGTNYSGFVFAAFTPDKPYQAKIIRAFQSHRQTALNDAIDIANFLQGRSLEGLVYDQAGRKHDKVAGAQSVIFVVERELKKRGVHIHRGCLMGQSRYDTSVPIVRQFLEPKKGDWSVEPRLVVNPSPESGGPLLRSQFRAYRFTTNAVELKGDNIKRGNDHALDGLRYLLSRSPTYTARGPNKINPYYGVEKRHDDRVMSDTELLEQRKMELSKQIAQGKVPTIGVIHR